MHFEASTSSSPPATDISPINAATDVKKRSRSDSTGHPLYGGVRRRSSGKWVSEIREPNTRSRIWLGTFANPEMAAAAHDAAALALHGAAATLNFPESAHRLPPAASSAHADIQRAALEAAREFSTSASSSTLSNNAGDSTSIFVDKENGDVSAGGDGGGRAEFLDEEAIFNMPLLLDSMAEGMLLTPPSMKKGFSWNQDDAYEYDDGIVDFTLWKH